LATMCKAFFERPEGNGPMTIGVLAKRKKAFEIRTPFSLTDRFCSD